VNVVPLQPVPSQTLSISLLSQNVAISVYVLTTGLYVDLSYNGTVIITARVGRNTAWLIGQTYSGFQGDFSFVDTQGNCDPQYTGLGTDENGNALRWQLVYFAPSDFVGGSVEYGIAA